MWKVLLLLGALVAHSYAQYYDLLLDQGLTKIPDDAKLTPEQLVAKYNFPIETHYVTTEDGYILTVWRIKHGNETTSDAPNKKVVFMQHGLLGTGHSFVCNHPEHTVSFLLANAGYDVWIGNNRGCYFGRNHTTLDPNKDDGFWEFSWEEMGKFDVRNQIKYVKEKTGAPKVGYVGHSEGTIQMFFSLEEFEEELSQDVYAFGALAPVARTGHISSNILHVLADIHLADLIKALGYGEFLGREWLLNGLLQFFCGYLSGACQIVLYMFTDLFPLNDDMEQTAVTLAYFPAGTSVKNMQHWAQLTSSNKFQFFDYGPVGNYKKYKQFSAPQIDLTKLHLVPIGLFCGDGDELADTADVNWLRTQLSPSVFKFDKIYEGYGHLTFVVGKTSEYVYDLIKFLDAYAVEVPSEVVE